MNIDHIVSAIIAFFFVVSVVITVLAIRGPRTSICNPLPPGEIKHVDIWNDSELARMEKVDKTSDKQVSSGKTFVQRVKYEYVKVEHSEGQLPCKTVYYVNLDTKTNIPMLIMGSLCLMFSGLFQWVYIKTLRDRKLSVSRITIPSMQTLISGLVKYRYFFLCLLIFGIMCLRTRNGQWVGDFWEHSAVVKELMAHILHPKHPQLLLDAPHAFYSPYAIIVALLARVLHLDVVMALSVMGLVNLCLLFFGLKIFIFSEVSKYRSEVVFYALLLLLFGWGAGKWFVSGFFHIGVLGFVLPYPSTFAVAISLIAFGCNRIRMRDSQQFWILPTFLIGVTVLISHPISFLFLAAGLVSQACAEKRAVIFQTVLIVSILCAVFLIAILWPYFPLLNFFMGESRVYDASNASMYQRVIAKIWPSLLGVPLILMSMRSNWRRTWILMLIILLGIYLLGLITGKYSYGRVISYIVLLLHLFIAEYFSACEAKVRGILLPRKILQIIVSAMAMVFVMFLFLKPLYGALPKRQSTYASYLFLSQFVGQNDVVLSDIESSWIVPTFGGKVIAARHPLAFVPDHDIRKSDLNHFFNKETTFEDRLQIIRKYKANYLLLAKSKDLCWQDLYRTFALEGRVVFENKSFALIFFDHQKWEDMLL